MPLNDLLLWIIRHKVYETSNNNGNYYTIADQTLLVEPPDSKFISSHYIITYTMESN